MTVSKLSAAALLVCLPLAACGEAPSGAEEAEAATDAAADPGPSPLQRLAPGQRYAGRMTLGDAFSRGADAYLLVEVSEEDDAETGRMAVTVDAFREADCDALFRGEEPWEGLCRHAAETGAPVVLDAPATFHRMSVTTGTSARPAGAFTTFADPRAEDAPPLHAHVLPGDGEFRLGARPKPDADMVHDDWFASSSIGVERMDAEDAALLDRRQDQVAALRAECAAKGCDPAR